MQIVASKVIAALAIPFFLYLTWVAGSWGLADVYARPAINTMTQWKQGTVRLDQDDWDGLKQDLTRALQLDPQNPELHQWMGTAIEGPYKSYLGDKAEGDAARRLAADHYRTSIRLQPTWPYAWDDLARVKFRLAELDGEYFNAVHKSVEYGPWEPGIQESVVRMGVVMWDQLAEAEKLVFVRSMANSLQHGNRTHATAMLKLLHRTKRLADVAAHDPQGVIDAVLLNMTGAPRQIVREMLGILDETNLFAQMTPENDHDLRKTVTGSLDQADETYRREVEEILGRHSK